MPRRAIISVLFVLTGTLTGSAAPLNTAASNATFQPRSTLGAAVLKPAQAKIPGGEQRLVAFSVQRIAPVWQTPAQIKISRTSFRQPDGAVVQPTVTKAAGGN